MSLAGRTAIVTGAGRGIGRAIADKLALDGGANVAMIDLEHINTSLKNTKTYEFDVSRNKDIEELMNRITKDMGQVPTILVNCAGITRDAFLWKMTEENYDQVMNINMRAPFFLTQQFSKKLISKSKESSSSTTLSSEIGSIVNISSIIGKVGNMGQTNYAASKGALVSFTKSAAQDLAKSRIRVNAILPGFIETPMAAAVPENVMEIMKQKIPMGRLGDPDDIAEAALFLASEKSKYITGACLEVTGGMYM